MTEQDMNSSAAEHEPGQVQGLEVQEPASAAVQWISIPDAALHFNISERAIYKRCRSGTLPRRTVENGRVEVAVPATALVQELDSELRIEVQELGHEPQAQSSETGHEQNIEPGPLVEALTADIAFLRSELTAQREQHTQEIVRRDVAEAELRRLLLADRQEIARLREQLIIVAAPLVQTPERDAPEPRAETPQDTEIAVTEMQTRTPRRNFVQRLADWMTGTKE